MLHYQEERPRCTLFNCLLFYREKKTLFGIISRPFLSIQGSDSCVRFSILAEYMNHYIEQEVKRKYQLTKESLIYLLLIEKITNVSLEGEQNLVYHILCLIQNLNSIEKYA